MSYHQQLMERQDIIFVLFWGTGTDYNEGSLGRTFKSFKSAMKYMIEYCKSSGMKLIHRKKRSFLWTIIGPNNTFVRILIRTLED